LRPSHQPLRFAESPPGPIGLCACAHSQWPPPTYPCLSSLPAPRGLALRPLVFLWEIIGLPRTAGIGPLRPSPAYPYYPLRGDWLCGPHFSFGKSSGSQEPPGLAPSDLPLPILITRSAGIGFAALTFPLENYRAAGIRTRDLFHPKEARYQTALRPERMISYTRFSAPRKLELPLGFEFPRVSGNSSRRGATCQIARVRQHPSHPTRRGNRKGRGGVRGPMGGGRF